MQSDYYTRRCAAVFHDIEMPAQPGYGDEEDVMNIRIATSDTDIAACYPVMQALRLHVEEEGFLARVRSQEISGYRLAFMEQSEIVVAVAGFRVAENLAWGRFLYVDDFVTHPLHRSKGYGAKLMSWLKGYAADNDCLQLHLDSGMHRNEAHRFYEREGMTKASFHFSENIDMCAVNANVGVGSPGPALPQ